MSVDGPPAAIAPRGAVDPAHATSARARGVGPVARTAESSASNSTSSCTDPRGRLATNETGERVVDGSESLEDQIVTSSQVGTLVRQDGFDLGMIEVLQSALTENHALTQTWQAVCDRFVDVQYPQIGCAFHRRGHGAVVEKVHQHAVTCTATSGSHSDLDYREDQLRADQKRQGKNNHVQNPQREPECIDFGGRGRRRPTVSAGNEQLAGNGQPRAECRQHRSNCDGLPQNQRRAWSAVRPRGAAQECGNRTGQQQGKQSENQCSSGVHVLHIMHDEISSA